MSFRGSFDISSVGAAMRMRKGDLCCDSSASPTSVLAKKPGKTINMRIDGAAREPRLTTSRMAATNAVPAASLSMTSAIVPATRTPTICATSFFFSLGE